MGSRVRKVAGSVVITSAIGVVAGSLPPAATRTVTSRSVNTPISSSLSFRMNTQPSCLSLIMRMASAAVCRASSRERLAAFLARFAERHPRVRLKVVYGSIQELTERLVEGRIDLAFSFERESDPAKRVVATRLFRQELVLVATREHYREDLDLDGLRRTPVVDYFQSDPVIARWANHHYRKRAARVPVSVWAATTNLVLDLILQRVGVGVLPDYVAEPHVKRRRLRIVRGSDRPLVDSIWLKELAGPWRSPAVAALREAAIEEFGE